MISGLARTLVCALVLTFGGSRIGDERSPLQSWGIVERLEREGALARLDADPAFAWALSINGGAPANFAARRIGPTKSAAVDSSVWSCDPAPKGSVRGSRLTTSCVQRRVKDGYTFRWLLKVSSFGDRPFVQAHQDATPDHIFQFGKAWPSVGPKWLPSAGALSESDVIAVCMLDVSKGPAYAVIHFRSKKTRAQVVELLRQHLRTFGVESTLSARSFSANALGFGHLDLLYLPTTSGRTA